mgnify:CR=1 FL=1
MPYRRSLLPSFYKAGNELFEDLIGLGFRLTGDRYNRNPNIENTLVAASIAALIDKTPRILPLLTDWISIHYERINAERLFIMVSSLDEKYEAVKVYWCSNAQRLNDKRTSFLKLRKLYGKTRRNITALLDGKPNSTDDGTDLLIQKNGEDKRFIGTCLRVPHQYIRERHEDVLTPEKLAKVHLAYRFRVMIGASYRADMWAALRRYPYLTAAEVARHSYGDYSMARSVVHDYSIVKRNYSSRGDAA